MSAQFAQRPTGRNVGNPALRAHVGPWLSASENNRCHNSSAWPMSNLQCIFPQHWQMHSDQPMAINAKGSIRMAAPIFSKALPNTRQWLNQFGISFVSPCPGGCIFLLVCVLNMSALVPWFCTSKLWPFFDLVLPTSYRWPKDPANICMFTNAFLIWTKISWKNPRYLVKTFHYIIIRTLFILF